MEYLKYIKDIILESRENCLFNIREEEKDFCIFKTIDCLLDLNIEKEKIYQVLNKYFNISYNKANEMVNFELKQLTKKSLILYMYDLGINDIEINNFIKEKRAFILINHEPKLIMLWKNPRELYNNIKSR